VHYPLPMSLVVVNPNLQDKQVMKKMIQRMGQTLNDFKQMRTTGASTFQVQPSQQKTAKEFFSKANQEHPVVKENEQLRQRLRDLERAMQKSEQMTPQNYRMEISQRERNFLQLQEAAEEKKRQLLEARQKLQIDLQSVRLEM